MNGVEENYVERIQGVPLELNGTIRLQQSTTALGAAALHYAAFNAHHEMVCSPAG
jgi:hypothetical protein